VNDAIVLEPVDRVEITTLYENLVDQTMAAGEAVERLMPKAGAKIVSTLLAEERRNPFVGGHGLSMLVCVTRQGLTRSILFDAGGSPEGLVHNLDCLELNPRDWNCIVLSHGHWDHTLGLIGLHRRLGRLSFPLTLHPDAYLKRAVVAPNGEIRRLEPLSRQGLRDAGVELLESERPSLVVEGMALVTGEVARTNDFETGWPAHHAERHGVWEPDPLICDDQGLVINLRGKGLVVLSGCGHAGIVNTVHHAQALTGIQHVHAVVGGFHLGPTFFHVRIQPVVEALVGLQPSIIAPAHCSGYRAAYAVYQLRPDAFVQNTVGTRITLSAD
jgi:7,8-dihydropterin-6-yl-methyl-4-(beta-D-ribofuranosyl)aminobenzene 5'-phosphate synthase